MTQHLPSHVAHLRRVNGCISASKPSFVLTDFCSWSLLITVRGSAGLEFNLKPWSFTAIGRNKAYKQDEELSAPLSLNVPHEWQESYSLNANISLQLSTRAPRAAWSRSSFPPYFVVPAHRRWWRLIIGQPLQNTSVSEFAINIPSAHSSKNSDSTLPLLAGWSKRRRTKPEWS